MKNITIIFFSALILIGCGSVKVMVKPNTNFSGNSTITISAARDPIAVQGKLEHLFLSRGYEVVSEIVARDRIKYQDNIENKITSPNQTIPEKSSAEASLERVKEFKSAYVLKFKYSAYWDVFYYSFEEFSASIVDLSTGEIVTTVLFSGDRSVDSVLEELVEKISKIMGKTSDWKTY